MLPGPVFNVELITTARRWRYFAARFFYGLLLLFFIWESIPYYQWHSYAGGTLSIQQMAQLGETLFRTFVITQAVVILVVTPALVAGVIAEERQRKTLHYLLASQLTSSEIILGKLMARLLHVGVFLGVGWPIMSLLSLFGGIDPRLIVLAFAATFTSAFFLAALGVLVSTATPRPREAITLVYVLELAWLFLPPLVTLMMPMGGGFWLKVYEVIKPVNDWLNASSPFQLVLSRTFGPGGQGFEPISWMMGLQVVYGVAFVILAIARLRPIFRKEGDNRGPLARLVVAAKRGGRFFGRPECGDDAMLWKERYVARTSLTTKAISFLVVVFAGGWLLYGVYSFGRPAFVELAEYGYGDLGRPHERGMFNGFLRPVCAAIYIFWMLALAAASAGIITHEREEDTWLSLLATPLDGAEIVHAKMVGAFWGLRWLGFLMAGLWLVGVASGAIHPFGLAAAATETIVFAWFVVALGTYISLRSKSSSRAIATTIAILVVLNGGYLMCCIPFQPNTMLIAVGVTPFHEAVALTTYGEIRIFFETPTGGWTRQHYDETAFAGFIAVFVYGAAAAILTSGVYSQFDEIVDRPRHDGSLPPFPIFPKAEPKDEIG